MAKKQGFSSSSSAAASSSSEWPDEAVAVLLESYTQKFSVDRGYLRTKDWEEVAHSVNSFCEGLKAVKTLKQCRDKVDSLKRRYKMERRKAVNGDEVSWPFFHSLDDIMNSVLKQGKGHHHHHHHRQSHPHSPCILADADADADADDNDDDDDDDEKEAEALQEEEKRHDSNSHDDLAAASDSPLYLENGKALVAVEDVYDLSDTALHPYPYHQQHQPYNGDDDDHHQQQQHQHHYRQQHGYDNHHHLHQKLLASSRPYNFSGRTLESAENSSRGKAQSRAAKRKLECDNGIEALADAVTGLSKPGSAACFSDVFARIELAKMEIFSKMKLELAKLEMKRHKKGVSKSQSPSSMSTGS